MHGDYTIAPPAGGLQFPTYEDCFKDPNRVIAYRERVFSRYAAYRRRLEARWAVNYQYLIDNQWLDLVSQAIGDPSNSTYSLTFRWAEDGTPRPVTNILAPNIDIELATFNKRKFMPKAVASSTDPSDTNKARKMTDVLRTRAEKENWWSVRQRAGLHLVASGTGSIRTWWDQDYTDYEEVPSPFAVQCSACDQIVADAVFPGAMRGQVKYNTPSIKAVENDPLSLQLTNCPNCDQLGTLRPTELNELNRGQRDMFQRALFVRVPKGHPTFQALDPFMLYPENGGIGVTYEKYRVIHSVVAQDLDWIADRHPQWANSLRPDSQTDCIRRNPLLGDFSTYQWYGPSVDSNVYTHHALYYEMVALPSSRLPEGLIIRSANNLIEALPLMWKYVDPNSGFTVTAPRVQYACGVWRERPGEFFGHGMLDRGRSLQNRLNGRDAQIVDIHERLANPHIMAATDMNITGPSWFEGRYSGKHLRYDRSMMAPDDKPEVFGGISPPSGMWQERDRIIQDTRFILGPAEVEQGMSAKNISTTSGLQLQGENAELRRGPDEDMLDFMCRTTWTAVMKQEQAFRVTKDHYDSQDPESKTWKTEVYDRIAVQGNFRMEIEKTAFVSKSIADREASREAQADGLYIIAKPADRKKILEQRGLPTDINQDENRQVDCASAKVNAFLKSGTVPTIDYTLDNFSIHFDVFGTELLGDEFKKLAQEAKWELILPLLTDWEIMLTQRMGLDDLSRKFYGMWTPYEQMVKMYAELTKQFEVAQVQYKMQLASMPPPMEGQPAPKPPIAPVAPPVPVILPRPLNLKILTVWKELMTTGGWPMMPPADALVVDKFLRFRAVYESYRLMTKWGGPTPMPAVAPGAPAPAPGSPAPGPTPAGIPAAPPNTANAPNMPTPGTSLAMSNATQAVTGDFKGAF